MCDQNPKIGVEKIVRTSNSKEEDKKCDTHQREGKIFTNMHERVIKDKYFPGFFQI